MKIKYTTRTVIAVALLVTLTGVASATSTIQYSANPDPTTQDGYLTEAGNQFWTLTYGPYGTTVGTGIMDGTTPAWKLDTITIAQPEREEWWSITPTVADRNLGNTKGWVLTTNLRLPTTSDAVGHGVSANYSDGSKLWLMQFGTDGDGDPIAQLAGDPISPSFTLEGAGNSAYHVYQLKFDPSAGTADLFVDGVEQISNFGGYSLSTALSVSFGDLVSGDAGYGLYNLVEMEFAPVPEPSVAGLLALGGLVFAGWRRRKQ